LISASDSLAKFVVEGEKMSDFQFTGVCRAASGSDAIAIRTEKRSHVRRLRPTFLAAAAILSVATVAYARDSTDGDAQSKQIREQNRILAKKVEQLEKRLRKIETRTARRPATAAMQSASASPPPPVYKKAPRRVSDDGSLTWHGITLYGSIDMGVGYQTHGAPLSNSAGFGLAYLISKNGNRPYFGVAPNALGGSFVGLKGDEQLVPGLSAVFNLQTSFLPTSGRLSDGLGSIVQNNGLPATSQTTFADSSKDGQPFNTVAYAGLSSPTYGTVTYGRQNSLTLDGVIAYDPMGASGAFSLIGFQGATAGMGDTEDARLDNSFKYSVKFGPFRAAAAAQLSPDSDGSRSIVQGQLGADYAGLSVDAIYGHVKDAISAAPLAVGFTPTPALLANAGNGLVAGTISDNTGLMLLGRYLLGPVKLYAGYENIRFTNPSDPLAAGTSIIGGYSLGTANNTAFTDNKLLQVFWTGADYAVRSDLDLIVAYYRETQNSFSGNGCTNASLAQCSGQLNAFSVLANYRFAKGWNAYAGAMYSEVSNGLASGFLATSNFDPTVGVRFQF
jgi:predicted porin